jgi:transcriptional regulator with XRE-family HTH domain
MMNDVIREKLKIKGMSNLDLAEKAGLSISTLNKILNGIVLDPRRSTLIAIADALECSIDDFSTRKVYTPEEQIAIKKYEKYKKLSAKDKRIVDAILESDQP